MSSSTACDRGMPRYVPEVGHPARVQLLHRGARTRPRRACEAIRSSGVPWRAVCVPRGRRSGVARPAGGRRALRGRHGGAGRRYLASERRTPAGSDAPLLRGTAARRSASRARLAGAAGSGKRSTLRAASTEAHQQAERPEAADSDVSARPRCLQPGGQPRPVGGGDEGGGSASVAGLLEPPFPGSPDPNQRLGKRSVREGNHSMAERGRDAG